MLQLINTDEMYIRYFKTFTPAGCYNRVYYEGNICHPEDFAENIKAGYMETIKNLYHKRQEISEHIKQFFTNNLVRGRYLIQTTASYARFTGLLHHIVALRNNNVLDQIRFERKKTFIGSEIVIQDFILDNEMLDIVNGVIPYFYRTNKSNGLYHASGAFRDSFFTKTFYEEIEDHILNIKIDEDILKSDCEFITKALDSTARIVDFEDFKNKFNFPIFDFDNKLKQA